MKLRTLYKKRLCRLVIFTTSIILLFIGAAVFVKYSHYPFFCVFNRLTGLKCPGCGNTRAVFAYLRLDFLNALQLNFLFPLEALYVLWVYLLSSKEYLKNGKYRYISPCIWIDISFLVLLVAWSVFRNCFGL